MANYSSNLKAWGDKGAEYPDGHSQQDGVPPVDAWHDYLFYNQIEDIQHLIELTNDRLESDIGTSYVTSPEDGHRMFRSDTATYEVYDPSSSSWKDVAWGSDFRSHKNDTTNPHSVTLEQARSGDNIISGAIDFNGNDVLNTGSITAGDGNLRIDSDGSTTGSVTIRDAANAADLLVANEGGVVNVPGTLQEGGSRVATRTYVDSNSDKVNISEQGTQILTEVDDINFSGFLNVTDDGDGTVSIDPSHNHDSRYLNDGTGTVTATNLNFDPATQSDLHTKYTDSEAVSAVNAETSLSVSISGDADTVDGNHASAFASSGHTHDGRYYTESQADSNFAPSGHNHDGRYARLYDGVQAPVYSSKSNVPSGIGKGELVFIDGDGLYVEDGT